MLPSRRPSQADLQSVPRVLVIPIVRRCLGKPETVSLASEVPEGGRNKIQSLPRMTLTLAEGVVWVKRVVWGAKGFLRSDLGKARGWMQGLASEVDYLQYFLLCFFGSAISSGVYGFRSLTCLNPIRHLDVVSSTRMVVPLSEKAKGKQRAPDPPEIGQTSSTALAPRVLNVRFAEGESDLIVHAEEKDTVKDVKQKVFTYTVFATRAALTGQCGQIRDARPELQRRRLRLIHSGRLLTDGTLVSSWLTSSENAQRNLIASGEEGALPAHRAPTWLHCSVGAELAQGEEEENLNHVRPRL